MKTMDVWNSIGVYNSHLLVKLYRDEAQSKKAVYLSKSVNDGQRASMGVLHGIKVIRPGYKTNPESKSLFDQNKEFFQTFSRGVTHAERWEATFAAAEQWTKERYGIEGTFQSIVGFAPDRFPPEIVAWAKEKFKQIKKSLQEQQA